MCDDGFKTQFGAVPSPQANRGRKRPATDHLKERPRPISNEAPEYIDNEATTSTSYRPYVIFPFYGEHKRAVSSVAFCPTASKPSFYTDSPTYQAHSSSYAICASASADGTVKLWDLTKDIYESGIKKMLGTWNDDAEPNSNQGANRISVDEPTINQQLPSDSLSRTSSPKPLTTAIGNKSALNDTNRIKPCMTLSGHSRGINDIAWSPRTCEFIASASDDKTLRIWDVTRGSIQENASSTKTRVDHAGSCLVTGSNTIYSKNCAYNAIPYHSVAQQSLSSTCGEALVELKGHSNFVFSVAFHPHGNLIASGSFDETVKLWDVRCGSCISTLPAHSEPCTSVDFNCDGTCIVSSSHDGLIRIWDVATSECLKTIYAQDIKNPPVSYVKYSPNGKYVLSSMLDGKIRLWNVYSKFITGGIMSTMKKLGTLGNDSDKSLETVLMEAGIGGDSNNTSTSLNMGGRCTKTYTGHSNTKYCIFSKFMVSNPKCPSIVTGGEDGSVTIYDLQRRSIRQVLDEKSGGHTDAVLAVDAHDSNEILATGGMSNDRKVKFWIPSPTYQ